MTPFNLPRSQNFLLRWMGAALLLTSLAAAARPDTATEVVHMVKEPTGKAVQLAIDACAAQGGGVVCLPPGRYVSGPLWLKDNIELRLEAGATVVLSHERKDWPAGVRALVNAKGAKHIAITGRGAFDGDAQWEYAPVRGKDSEIAEEQDIARRAGVEMKRYYRKGEVRFVDVTFETNRRHWNWWGSAEVMKFVLKKRTSQSRLGRIRDITIDGAQGTARGTSLVAGHAERKLENIIIANLRVKMLAEDQPDKRATDALVFQGIDGLTLRDVVVDWDREQPEPQWGSALVLRDISNLVLQNFRGQAARPDGPLPAVVEKNVSQQRSP